ncbi:glycine zipper family protein [bacterium]|nr:glycine zipper family protein [bacterium]
MFCCKNCGKKIANKSTVCKYCGYKYNSKAEISNISENIKINDDDILSLFTKHLPINFNEIEALSKAENILNVSPALYEIISKKFFPKTIKGIVLNSKIQKLIDSGELQWMKASGNKCYGALLKNGKIFKQISFKDINISQLNIPYIAILFSVNKLVNEVKNINHNIEKVNKQFQINRIKEIEHFFEQINEAQITQNNDTQKRKLQKITDEIGLPIKQIQGYFEEILLPDINKKKIKNFNKLGYEYFECIKTITIGYYIKAKAYYNLNDNENTVNTLNEYNNYLEKIKINDRNSLLKINSEMNINAQYNQQIINIVEKMKHFSYINLQKNSKQIPKKTKLKYCKCCNKEIPNSTKDNVCNSCKKQKIKNNIISTGKSIVIGIAAGAAIPSLPIAITTGAVAGAVIGSKTHKTTTKS